MSSSEVKGLRQLNKKLKKLPQDIRQKVLQAAVTAAAKDFVPEVEGRVPRDSGDLATTIKARKVKTNSKYTAASGVRPRKSKGVDPYYWYWVELGTELQPPQPYMRPGFDAGVSAAKLKFKSILKQGIKRHAN